MNWRCLIGRHRLHGWLEHEDGWNAPHDPRTTAPPPGARRFCIRCGQRWYAAFDGLRPYWRKGQP